MQRVGPIELHSHHVRSIVQSVVPNDWALDTVIVVDVDQRVAIIHILLLEDIVLNGHVACKTTHGVGGAVDQTSVTDATPVEYVSARVVPDVAPVARGWASSASITVAVVAIVVVAVGSEYDAAQRRALNVQLAIDDQLALVAVEKFNPAASGYRQSRPSSHRYIAGYHMRVAPPFDVPPGLVRSDCPADSDPFAVSSARQYCPGKHGQASTELGDWVSQKIGQLSGSQRGRGIHQVDAVITASNRVAGDNRSKRHILKGEPSVICRQNIVPDLKRIGDHTGQLNTPALENTGQGISDDLRRERSAIGCTAVNAIVRIASTAVALNHWNSCMQRVGPIELHSHHVRSIVKSIVPDDRALGTVTIVYVDQSISVIYILLFKYIFFNGHVASVAAYSICCVTDQTSISYKAPVQHIPAVMILDVAPITGCWTAGATIPICVSAIFIIASRGEHHTIRCRTLNFERSIYDHPQSSQVPKLDYASRLDRQSNTGRDGEMIVDVIHTIILPHSVFSKRPPHGDIVDNRTESAESINTTVSIQIITSHCT